MYSFDEKKRVINFYDEQNGQQVDIDCWNVLQKDILMELCDNGFAMLSNNMVSVSPENIYQLDEIERKMLGLPSEYPYDMYVEANDSTLTQDDFQYKISFYSFYPGGDMLSYSTKGCFLVISGTTYLFNKEQYALYQAIMEFNALEPTAKNKRTNFVRFADIKSLSRSAAKLDSYLVDTDVCIPNKIKVLVDYADGTLHLSAAIDNAESAQFTEKFWISLILLETNVIVTD